MEGPAEVRGAFDDVEDIIAAPTPFTPACDKHPLAPIAGPIAVRGAKASRAVAPARLTVAKEPLRAAGCLRYLFQDGPDLLLISIADPTPKQLKNRGITGRE
jgi:hypothetical protein